MPGLAFLLAAMLLAVAPVMAHSEKEIVTPVEDSTVDGSPPAIGMSFDSAMRITQIRLTDGAGKAFALSRTDRMAPVTEFSAAPERLPPGAYNVEWSGISTDGHIMSGAWTFTVR